MANAFRPASAPWAAGSGPPARFLRERNPGYRRRFSTGLHQSIAPLPGVLELRADLRALRFGGFSA